MGDLAAPAGASSLGQANRSFPGINASAVPSHIKPDPAPRYGCLWGSLSRLVGWCAVALVMDFRQRDEILFSPVHISQDFPAAVGQVGGWVKITISFLCVKFISAYFSHVYIHMHAYRHT